MRASRATELAKSHPAHVAAAWCGHTQEVAMNHYWTVTDADYTKALAGTPSLAAPLVQIPAHTLHESTRTVPQANKPSECEGLVVRELALSCGKSQVCRMGEEGFEPPKT